MSESAAESDYDDGSDASEDEGSGSDFDDDSEGEFYTIYMFLLQILTTLSGDDWDELERKAAKGEQND